MVRQPDNQPDRSGRDDHGGILTVAEIRRVGAQILASPRRQRQSKLSDLMTDTVAGIANGAVDDPVAMCQEVCVVGGAVCQDPEAWLTWMESHAE